MSNYLAMHPRGPTPPHIEVLTARPFFPQQRQRTRRPTSQCSLHVYLTTLKPYRSALNDVGPSFHMFAVSYADASSFDSVPAPLVAPAPDLDFGSNPDFGTFVDDSADFAFPEVISFRNVKQLCPVVLCLGFLPSCAPTPPNFRDS
jgi:hypothetical protein